MFKKLSGIFIAMLLILFSCTEKIDTDNGKKGMVDFTIKTSIPKGIKTYASDQGGATNVTGKALRYIMEVWTQDNPRQLAYRDYYIVPDNFTTTYATFTVSLLAQKYDFVFWADFVDAGTTKATAQAADLFYKTSDGANPPSSTDLGLRNITMIAPYSGISDDARDAYFAAREIDLATSDVSSNNIELTRPFGKYRLIATDAPENFDFSTDQINVKIDYNAMSSPQLPSAFDALAGDVVANKFITVADYVAKATPENVTVAGINGNALMAFDYIFTPTSGQQIIQFNTTAYNGSVDDANKVGYREISNIPIERNKLTTIIGNFFSHTSNTMMIVKDNFDGTDDVNIQDIQKVPDDISTTKELWIPDYTITPTYTFDFTGTIDPSAKITLRDETVGDQLKNYQGEVYLTYTGTLSLDQLDINLPYASVFLNGVNITTLTAIVSPNTLHLDENCRIGTLTLTQGNVEIGSVATGTAAVVKTFNVTTGCKVFWGVKTAAEMRTKAAAAVSEVNNDGVFLLNDMTGLTYTDGSSSFAIGGYGGNTLNNATNVKRTGYIFDGKGHSLSGPITPPTGTTTTQSMMHVYANNVIVRNVTMTNTAGNGMTIYYCSGVRLENVKLLNNNNPSSPTNSYNGIGLIVNNSPGVTITGCDIEGNKTGGVNVSGSPSHFDFSDGTNIIGSVTGGLASSRYVWADGGASTSSVTAPSNWTRVSSTWHP